MLTQGSKVLRTGCQWRMLPHEFPNWKTVYHHFRSWSARGWFRHVLRILTRGRRGAIGQSPEPYVAVIDSQSVRWGHMQSPKGYDGHKRVKGIKRHIAVDDNGYPMEVVVTKALRILPSHGLLRVSRNFTCES